MMPTVSGHVGIFRKPTWLDLPSPSSPSSWSSSWNGSPSSRSTGESGSAGPRPSPGATAPAGSSPTASRTSAGRSPLSRRPRRRRPLGRRWARSVSLSGSPAASSRSLSSSMVVSVVSDSSTSPLRPARTDSRGGTVRRGTGDGVSAACLLPASQAAAVPGPQTTRRRHSPFLGHFRQFLSRHAEALDHGCRLFRFFGGLPGGERRGHRERCPIPSLGRPMPPPGVGPAVPGAVGAAGENGALGATATPPPSPGCLPRLVLRPLGRRLSPQRRSQSGPMIRFFPGCHNPGTVRFLASTHRWGFVRQRWRSWGQTGAMRRWEAGSGLPPAILSASSDQVGPACRAGLR